MSVTVSYPGVYVQELPSQSHAITGVATSITAFIGFTARGIDQRAQIIFSFADYQRLFGGLESDSELGYAVQQFFANGGSQAYVVRVPRPGGAYAAVSFSGLTFTALSKGAWANDNILLDIDWNNVSQTSDATRFNLTVTNLVDGTTESFLSVSLNPTSSRYVLPVVNDIDNGSELVSVAQLQPVQTTAPTITGTLSQPLVASAVTLAVGGTPLAGTVALTQNSANVTGTGTAFTTAMQGRSIVFGTSTSPIYTILTVTNATTIVLSAPYTGATAASTTATLWSTTATNNFALTFSVSSPATPPSALPLAVTVFPSGGTVPQSLAGLASQLGLTINRALALAWPGASVQCSVATTTNGSALRVVGFFPGADIDDVITVTSPTTTTLGDAAKALGFEPTEAASVAHYALGTAHSWGSTPAAVAGVDGTGLPGTADLIGNQLSFTGLYALDKVDLFNLLVIPDATRAAAGNPFNLDPAVDPNAVYSAAISYCQTRRAFLLLDCPPYVKDVPSAIDWKTSGLVVTDNHGAAFFPRVRLPDPLNNYQLRTFAPSGLVAGLYASINSSRGIWKAPAGTEATMSGVQSLVYKLTDAEQGVLNPIGLNCVRTFPNYGTVMWGARTLQGADADASQWKYVPVRRLALYIEASLLQGTQWAVFEPNDEPLWASLRLNIGSFMNGLFRNGAFQGQTPAQAYLVKCDSETTTQQDIDNGVVNVLVGFAPLLPAEFVVLQIQQLAGQSQS